MTKTSRKIQKMIDLRLKGLSPENIGIVLKTDKKTVKKYLWENGFVGQSYFPERSMAIAFSHKAAVPQVYSPEDSRWGAQQALPKRYEPQIVYVQDEHLKQELEERNRELDRQKNEKKEMQELLTKLIKALADANAINKTLTEWSTKTDLDQKAKIDTPEGKTQEQQRTISDQRLENERAQFKHQRDLEELKTKTRQKEQETITLQKEYRDSLQHFDDSVNTLAQANTSLRKETTNVTSERDKLKNEVTELKIKLADAPLTYGAIGFTAGVTAVIGGYLLYKGITAPSPVPSRVEPVQNTRYSATPVSGITAINPAGSHCSGAIFIKSGQTFVSGNHTIHQPNYFIPENHPSKRVSA